MNFSESRKKKPPARGPRGGERVELTIKGDPKEIAALVVALQERQRLGILGHAMDDNVKDIAQAICDRQQGAQEKSDNSH